MVFQNGTYWERTIVFWKIKVKVKVIKIGPVKSGKVCDQNRFWRSWNHRHGAAKVWYFLQRLISSLLLATFACEDLQNIPSLTAGNPSIFYRWEALRSISTFPLWLFQRLFIVGLSETDEIFEKLNILSKSLRVDWDLTVSMSVFTARQIHHATP